LLAIIFGLAAVIYWLWSPGEEVSDGRHDLGKNGIWLQHGWMASDDWLERNDKDIGRFRSPENIQDLSKQLKKYGIRYAYPHACPCHINGKISEVNHEQVERFLDHIGDEIKVIPWVGGVNGAQVDLADEKWRQTFVRSIASLLEQHPRLAGVQINVEPLHSGDAHFLLLLEELKQVIPEGKLISVAAYPPPTRWQPGTDVHWEESYFREVAKRVDQMAPMMYDTSIILEKPYIKLMEKWTKEVIEWSGDAEVLLGIPAYADEGVGYHHPEVENIESALKGIHAALSSYEDIPTNYAGIAIYSEWTMDEKRWQQVETSFSKEN